MIPIRVLHDRSEVDAALRLPKNLSYRIFAPSRACRGKVATRRVVEVLRDAGRNGVEIGSTIPDDLVGFSEIVEATGLSARSASRLVKRSPHFFLSGKVRLMHRSDLEKACC